MILRRTAAGVPGWLWLGATCVALVMIGPGLRPGALLNLDLLIIDELPVPHGMWGLGPELPRRVPLWGPMAWLSAVVGGEAVGKGFLVATIVVAAAGMYRLACRDVEDASSATALGAAALYALSPFVLTRLAIGQLNVAWVMALLPWATPLLLDPTRSRRAVLWWSAILGLGGVFGGVITGAVLLAGCVAARGQGAMRAVAAFLVGQLPWLTALTVVTITMNAESIPGSEFFRPRLDSAGDGARLLAGFGFWNGPFEVGGDQPIIGAVLGPALFVVALFGVRELPAGWRRPFTGLAMASLAFSASSSVWGIERAVNAFTDTPIGAPFRETQRFLVPYLLWLAPAAAAGAARLARAASPALAASGRIVPFAAAAALAGPGLWGLGGQLRPTVFPPEWGEARRIVHAEPGTVVALPWYQYFTIDVAHDHLVLGVVPYYFGGDVVTASDPNLSNEDRQEVPDPREPVLEEILARARNGAEVSDDLVDVGVRWIVVQREVDWARYSGLGTDAGLELVVTGPTLDLYRVLGWTGAVVGVDGRAVESDAIVSPVRRVAASGPATYATAYQEGWLRGTSRVGRTAEGLVALPAGSGLVWFWPSLLVLGADAVTSGVLLVSAVSGSLRRWRTR
jgi:hypothetical protein